jgi:TonB family protein
MDQGRKSVPVGHLTVPLADGDRPPEISFGFERQNQHMGGALGVAFLTHVAFAVLFVIAMRVTPPPSSPVAEPSVPIDRIVWLAEPGPGGGGGGGGNESPEPPQPAELPGDEELTVPVTEPPELEEPVDEPPEEEPLETFDIPAQTLASAVNTVPGAIEGVGPLASLGSGRGGGAGEGTGTGIGPGTGSGLGPGFGGGTGGGVYRPGNGVESPRLLRDAKPQYTADAMRAKIQGRVEIECVVETDGTCGRIEVVRSLDSVFGLDEEAIKAVRQWRFVPGRRQGQDVPVIVTIELMFTLR